MLKKQRYRELIIVFTIMTAFFAIILYFTGIYQSGFMFDDHQMYLTIKNALKEQPVYKVLFDFIKGELELKARFRPIFWMQYVLETWLFGLNWLALHIFRTVEYSLCFVILYWTAREYECNVIYSILFAAVSLIGRQVQVLYYLCAAGLIATLMIAMCLLCMVKYCKTNRCGFKWGFYFSLFMISISLEDYIVTVPVLVAAYIFMKMKYEKLTYREVLHKNWKMILAWALWFLLIAAYICFGLRVDLSGRMNFDSLEFGTGIATDINLAVSNMWGTLKALKWINCVVLVVSLFFLEKIFKKRYALRDILCVSGILISGLFVQLLIHSKAYMVRRYLLPYMLIIGWYVAILFYKEFREEHIKLKVCMVFLMCAVALQMKGVLRDCRQYAVIADEQEQCIQYIVSNTNENSIIWCAYNFDDDGDYNHDVGLQMMLEEKGLRGGYLCIEEKLIDLYNVKRDEGKEVNGEIPFIYLSVNYHPEYYRKKQYSDADIIFTKIGNEEELLTKVGDNKFLEDYFKQEFSRYAVYVKVNR